MKALRSTNIQIGGSSGSEIAKALDIIYQMRTVSPNIVVGSTTFKELFVANIQRLGNIVSAPDKVRSTKHDISQAEGALEEKIKAQEAERTARRLKSIQNKREARNNLMLPSAKKRKRNS